MMEKLFQDFKETGIDEWVDKIYKDLKDKPKDLLTYQPEFDLNVKSFYHRSEATKGNFPNGRADNKWKDRRAYKEATNKLLLSDLNDGIDCLGIEFTDQESFNELTKDVQFEFIDADVTFEDVLKARSFIGPKSIRLNFDVIGQGLVKGDWVHSMDDYLNFYHDQDQHQTIWVDGSIYGEAGATNTMELAFTANHANEYIQKLTDAGVSLEEINQKLVVELSVTEDYFANIAKFKLIYYIIGLVFKAYDEEYELKPFTVYAMTSSRYLAVNDHNNNLLRQTTMAMSAIIGGCDAITVQTMSTGNWDKDQIMERMAKNIPLILKEESYLDKVADAAEGAYYIEYLCTQMIRNAWKLFLSIEDKGGLIKCVEESYVQFQIAKNHDVLLKGVNEGKRTFLGVNKYPSTLEEWQVIPPEEFISGTSFQPFNKFRVELHFKNELHEQS